MSTPWRIAAAVLLAAAGFSATAHAGSDTLLRFESYKMEHRPKVVFPGKRVHVSPYPASKFAAAVWSDDYCWRTCTGQSGWRYQDCWRVNGPEACRQDLDANNRFCQRTCRSRGGPLLPLD